jgi:hypothetical protein
MDTTSLTRRNVSVSFAAANARVVSGPRATRVIEFSGFVFRSSRMMSTDGLGSGLKRSLFVFSPARREGQVVFVDRDGCFGYVSQYLPLWRFEE